MRRSGGLLRHALISMGDPIVDIEVEGVKLRAPLSHELPHYRRSHERYALNVALLAQLVSELTKAPTMVDIGANVGDTAALARSTAPGLPILCIEGDPGYSVLLKINAADWPDVEIHAPCFLADASKTITGRLQPSRGTTTFDSGSGIGVSASTLDDVLEKYPRFSNPSLIKSDTDGFEARIMAGAEKTIKRAQPVLLLEYHPLLLSGCGSDGLELLGRLREYKYGAAVVYDNLGYALCLTDIRSVRLFEDLHDYASRRPFFYFDFAVFPLDRSCDARELYQRETTHRKPPTRFRVPNHVGNPR
jgi:FkbM family methyltransferase